MSNPSAADKEEVTHPAASNPPKKPGVRAGPINVSNAPFVRVYRFLLGLLAMARTASATAFAIKADLETALAEFCTNQTDAEATYGAISTAWDVSAVTDMFKLINNAPCKSTFNSNVNAWDVGQVTSMRVRLASDEPPPPSAQPGPAPQIEYACAVARRRVYLMGRPPTTSHSTPGTLARSPTWGCAWALAPSAPD